jgi:archaetidylinositol phosphate synthase
MSIGTGGTVGTFFRDAVRVQQALTAPVERRVLLWLARRTPRWVQPDHLTALGFAAQFWAGVSYAAARWHKYALAAAIIFIALNWLGDSLDGTLARFRGHLRPRFGFYVDHMVDTFGAGFLMLGLAFSRYLHWQIAVAMLVAFLVLSIETYLAAYTLADFRLSHGMFGPTEIRILLSLANIGLMFSPHGHVFGNGLLWFDLAGVIATMGMLVMAIRSAVTHTIKLYMEERLR